MKLQISSILLVFLLISQHSIDAQKRFSLSAMAGLNLAQIDGDNVIGFDQKGIMGGLNLSTFISKGFNLDIELLYSERGASTGPFRGFYGTGHFFDINLTYAEVPILMKIKFGIVKGKTRKEEDWFKSSVSAGLSFNRLIKADVSERIVATLFGPEEKVSYLDLVKDFEDNEINLVLALSHLLLKKFGVSVRFSYGLSPLYKEQETIDFDRNLHNYFISGLCFYNF
jgi:hypothetical protein